MTIFIELEDCFLMYCSEIMNDNGRWSPTDNIVKYMPSDMRVQSAQRVIKHKDRFTF